MPSVFDNGSFSLRIRRDNKKSPDWNEGFNEGYEAARERYINTDRARNDDTR